MAKRAKDCETEILSPADGVEEKKKEKLVQRAASSVAVILRSWSKVEFAVFGLRLPPGVDRQGRRAGKVDLRLKSLQLHTVIRALS